VEFCHPVQLNLLYKFRHANYSGTVCKRAMTLCSWEDNRRAFREGKETAWPHGRGDCETVGIPPLMSRKTLGILDGGRGGAVDRSWRCRRIRGVDKGGA